MKYKIENLDEVFFPNELTQQQIAELSGWRLKVAALHFGKSRGDCVRFGYGYALLVASIFDNIKSIHLVAQSKLDGSDKELIASIDLVDEIEWEDAKALLRECGMGVDELLQSYITTAHNEWFPSCDTAEQDNEGIA